MHYPGKIYIIKRILISLPPFLNAIGEQPACLLKSASKLLQTAIVRENLLELKYIICKGTPYHDVLTKAGLANITDKIKMELIERFLLPKISTK